MLNNFRIVYADANVCGRCSIRYASCCDAAREALEGYWSEYDDVQTKLELRDEAEANHCVTFEEAFYSLFARMRKFLSLASLARVAVMPSPSSSNSAVVEHFSHIKLPKLELKIFWKIQKMVSVFRYIQFTHII